MSKKYLMFAILLVAAGCSRKTVSVTTPPSSPTTTPITTTTTPANPTAAWTSYTSPAKYGFSIKYPTDFGFNTDIGQISGMNIEACNDTDLLSGSLAGCAYYTGNSYQGTNFDAASVSVRLDPTLNTEAKCYNFSSQSYEAQTPVADVTINGVIFKSAMGGGAAAGTSDKLQVYRSLHNNICYEIDQAVFQSDGIPVGNPPSIPPQYNENEVWQNLQSIVNTFTFSASSQPPAVSVQYNNNQYGFIFTLPADWKGFTTYTSGWTGTNVSSGNQEATGTIVYIRNPKWTKNNPYEDIPVMVFTLSQWQQVSSETMAVSAAPFPPTEYAQNKTYVFALPPRFDYDYRTGYQEVEGIVQNNPLQAY